MVPQGGKRHISKDVIGGAGGGYRGWGVGGETGKNGRMGGKGFLLASRPETRVAVRVSESGCVKWGWWRWCGGVVAEAGCSRSLGVVLLAAREGGRESSKAAKEKNRAGQSYA